MVSNLFKCFYEVLYSRNRALFAALFSVIKPPSFVWKCVHFDAFWPCVHTKTIRKRIHLKTLFKMETFKKALFRTRVAFSEDGENRRFWKRWRHVCSMRMGSWLLKWSVIRRISVFECFSVDGENAAKTIVWTRSFWCVFGETKLQRFENALVC